MKTLNELTNELLEEIDVANDIARKNTGVAASCQRKLEALCKNHGHDNIFLSNNLDVKTVTTIRKKALDPECEQGECVACSHGPVLFEFVHDMVVSMDTYQCRRCSHEEQRIVSPVGLEKHGFENPMIDLLQYLSDVDDAFRKNGLPENFGEPNRKNSLIHRGQQVIEQISATMHFNPFSYKERLLHVCLQRVNPCPPNQVAECFLPMGLAFRVKSGVCELEFGYQVHGDRFPGGTLSLNPGSSFALCDPDAWYRILPSNPLLLLIIAEREEDAVVCRRETLDYEHERSGRYFYLEKEGERFRPAVYAYSERVLRKYRQPAAPLSREVEIELLEYFRNCYTSPA